MRSLNNISFSIVIAVLVFASLYSGYLLFNLTGDLEEVSGRIDLNAIQEASSVFNKLYLGIGFTLTLFVISVIWFLYKINSSRSIQQTAEGNTADGKWESSSKVKPETESENSLQKNLAAIKAAGKNAKDIETKCNRVLAKLCMTIEASQGLFYEVKKEKNKRRIELVSSFAYNMPESEIVSYEFGEGLCGQAAKEGKKLNINEIPEGYIKILSGLGSSSPNHLAIIPIKYGDEIISVAEIASFKEISAEDERLIEEALKFERPKTPVKSGTATKSRTASKTKEKVTVK